MKLKVFGFRKGVLDYTAGILVLVPLGLKHLKGRFKSFEPRNSLVMLVELELEGHVLEAELFGSASEDQPFHARFPCF